MAEGLPDLLVQSILQAFNAGRSGWPGDSRDDRLEVDTADMRRRVAAGADVLGADPALGVGRFARSLPKDDAPFRPEPYAPGRLDGFLKAQTPENARAADKMFAGDENLAEWTGRNTPKGFGAVLEGLVAPAKDIMQNYRPGEANEPLNQDIGRRGFQAGPMTIGPPGVARAAAGARGAAELGAAGGKLSPDDLPGIIVAMKRDNPAEFTRAYTEAYEALAAEIPALKGAAATAGDVGRPMSQGAVASDKLAKAGGAEADRIGEIAERAAAFRLWQQRNGGETELGAFGSAPKRTGALKGSGRGEWATKVGELVDAHDPTTPAKELLRRYRASHGEGQVTDGTLLNEIGVRQRAAKREAVDTIYQMPATQDILRRAAESGSRNYAVIANDIRNALDIPATSKLITTADVHAQMAKLAGREVKPTAPRGARAAPNRDVELLNSPQIEQLILEADRRGEAAGMVTNMVRRAMGITGGGQHRSSGITTEAVTRKIGELRDKTRRMRGAGDE